MTIGEANGTPAVFFSDAGATMYALNAQTGELIWKVRPVDHFATMATATPRFYKGVVYQPFSSFEEALGADPKFECCTFRGSVVALDAGTGKKIWQTFTIPEAAKPTRKSSGGNPARWVLRAPASGRAPTIDEQLGVSLRRHRRQLFRSADQHQRRDPGHGSEDRRVAVVQATDRKRRLQQRLRHSAANAIARRPQVRIMTLDSRRSWSV